MGQPVPPPPSGGTDRGIASELANLAGSFGRHVQTLLALASLESKEAAGVYVRVVVAVLAGLVALLFGYLLALVTLAFLIALVFGVAWIWILLGFTLLHFAAVAAAVIYVKQRLAEPVFTATSMELKKDFDALSRIRK